jgi:hypothetical protein
MMLSAATAHAVSISISTLVPCRAARGQHTCNRFRKPMVNCELGPSRTQPARKEGSRKIWI